MYSLRSGLFAFLELGAATKIDEKLPKYPYRCRAGCSGELMAVGRWKGVIGSVISPVEGSSLFYYFITARMGQVLRATSGWANDGASVYLSFVFEYFLLIFFGQTRWRCVAVTV